LFLGASAKFRKTAINFVISVRLYVRMEQIGSIWKDLVSLIFKDLMKTCREI